MEQERLVDRAAEMGAYFIGKLQELQTRHESIGDVRGKGLMLAVDFVTSRATREHDTERRDRVVNNCFRHGLMVLPCGFSAIRFTPALVVDRDQIDRATDILERAIRES
jgi:4-aminobutyrate aminotransferase